MCMCVHRRTCDLTKVNTVDTCEMALYSEVAFLKSQIN